MWTGTGCDSSAAFKALVSPPPVLSAETRSFEDLVSGAGKLQLRCNGCGHTRPAKALSPEQVRATGGDFTQLLRLSAKHVNCPHDGGSHQIHPHHMSSWQKFFDAAWASLKASDDHEKAMAAHPSRSIFTLV